MKKNYNQSMILLTKVIVGLLVLFIYTPFILNGGYGSSDDLSIVLSAKDSNSPWTFFIGILWWGDNYARPISWLITSIALVIFGDYPAIYILFGIIFWLLSVFIISYTVKALFGKMASSLFLIIAAFPFFASSFLYNAPSYFAQYTLPLLFSLHW